MRKYLLFIFFILHVSINAQQEAAIWYFGENAGLDFNSGTPVPLTDGVLVTQEGCASIADFNGNLLFYTDGITIWNSNHIPMPNGTGLNGDVSSTQSGIIVPSPGNPNLYFVFTVHDAGEPEGLQYSMVDMTLSGGLGDVTTKNVRLATPVTEKLTAVQHANGTDIWVLAHRYGSDEFLAYLVTPTGLITTPVVSAEGINHPILNNGEGSRGYMKVSPDGQYLAAATSGTSNVEVFRFDPFTGAVSNGLILNDYFPPPPIFTSDIMYGVEFSSDSSKLYIGYTLYLNATNLESSIHQFDMLNYNQTTIIASGVEIAPPQPIEIGALQLAIDGKIYVAQFDQTYMGAINNPNIQGLASDYVENSVSLAGRTNRLGLPPFIQSFFIIGLRAQNFCLGDATAFSVTSSDPITSILWDFGDTTTSTLENPTHTYAVTGTYTVSVTVNTATDTKTESKDITIYETPVANTVADILGCTSYGSYNLDLPSFNPAVLGTQDLANVIVDYFLSQQDADDNTNPLAQIHSFDYGTTPVFVRVANSDNSLCYSTTQFNVIARQAPLVDVIADWTVCDDNTDGQYLFDLSLKNAEIFNGQDTSIFEILYFASQADADAGTNPLPINYTNTVTTEEIFFRFQNSAYPTCFRTGSFTIEVIEAVTANTPTNLEICDDNNDGQAIFDLTQTEAEVIGAQNAASLLISYHASQADADTNSSPLPGNYTSTSYQTTIYVRVANSANESCYDTTAFELLIYYIPVMPAVSNWEVCDDDNDGQFNFDLSEKNTEILDNATGLTLTYHESQVAAEQSQNAITAVFQNTINPQLVYFRLENENNASCYVVGSFEVRVYDTPTANQPSDIVVCDDDQTGSYSFNFVDKDNEVLNGQNAASYSVSYHTTDLDAMNNENPLPKTNYNNSSITETIYVRIQQNDLDHCYDTSSFQLIINPLPGPNLEERYVICPDSPDLTIDGGVFETWDWKDTNGITLGTDQTIAIEEIGNYSLTVTATQNGIVCENTVAFEVVSSGAPETMRVDTSGFSDVVTLTIEATGIGDFEYSVDGNTYQTSNTFEVFPGEYTVYVRDPFECRTLSDTIFVVGYQKFFTPNGDNTNEFWNIIGVENYPLASVTIYDRYGKLIKQVPTSSIGWDGTYLGNPLPAADYWFKFDTGEGQSMTGHFTLKR